MFLDDILKILYDAGLGTKGVDLCIGNPPEIPLNVISVVAAGGRNPDHVMGGSLAAAAMEYPRFQVIVRNGSAQAAFTKSLQARAALRWYNGTVNSTVYHNIVQIGDLNELVEDHNKGYRVVGTYEAQRDP